MEAKIPWSSLDDFRPSPDSPWMLNIGYQNTSEIYLASWRGIVFFSERLSKNSFPRHSGGLLAGIHPSEKPGFRLKDRRNDDTRCMLRVIDSFFRQPLR
jgi:hypothetical protein